MELKENDEELLETLWVRTEEKKETSVSVDDLDATERKSVDKLLKIGYINLVDGRSSLTEQGRPYARNVIRRHRLAERLLADVLGTRDRLMHEKACKFEHLLDRGLDESICSLLGHPKVCPHGKPIPPGRCCQEGQATLTRLIAPLSQMAPGQKGEIAYIYAPKSDQLRKLVAMGVLPGASVSVMQVFPSYVFQAGQTQFAVDKEIADAIYIRMVDNVTFEPVSSKLRRRGRSKGWGRIGRNLRRWWPG